MRGLRKLNQILSLREKRAKAWDAAKAFLDSKRGPDGMLSAEDAATYDKMEADVVALGKEVERLERQAALDRELNQPVDKPITERPAAVDGKGQTGRASDEYKAGLLAHHARQVGAARGAQRVAGGRGVGRRLFSAGRIRAHTHRGAGGTEHLSVSLPM